MGAVMRRNGHFHRLKETKLSSNPASILTEAETRLAREVAQ
jgi:hypothetical protein